MEEAFIVLSVLVVATNAVVICMVIFIKELRTFTNYFVVSLAVSDLLTGGILLPLQILSWYSSISVETNKASGYFVCLIMTSGVENLCAVTWDRYIAITDPFSYKSKLKKYYKKILLAIWLTVILWPLITLSWDIDMQSVYHKSFLVISFVVFIIIPYVFIVVAYVRIWSRLREHATEMKRMDITNETREKARKASLEGKTVKVFLVVMTCFLLSWLPVMYMTVADSVVGRSDLIPHQLAIVSLFTIAGSSLVNPILYAILKRDFKAQLQRIRIHRVVQQPSTVDHAGNAKVQVNNCNVSSTLNAEDVKMEEMQDDKNSFDNTI